jgi:hypothetical protein
MMKEEKELEAAIVKALKAGMSKNEIAELLARTPKPSKDKCKRGHPLSGYNLMINHPSGRKRCRTCFNASVRQYNSRPEIKKKRNAYHKFRYHLKKTALSESRTA